MWGVSATTAYLVASAAVTAGTAAYQAHEARDAQRDAKEQAKKDKADALRAEQFADTEGEGQGMLGNISLAIDEDVDTDILSGTSNISI